jgi:hypothetical protein
LTGRHTPSILDSMNEPSVGILERRDDRFMADVAALLGDIPVEFISLRDEAVPIAHGYRVVVDRLSFRYPFLREIMKSMALSGSYVINNPFAASVTNKLVEIRMGIRLGLPFPKTIVLPDQSAINEAEGTVAKPDLHHVATEIGFPCILKPFDGYAWQDVYIVRSADELENLYLALSNRSILLAQQYIEYRDYFRVFCFDKKDVLFVRWVPKPMAMGQYLHCSPGDIQWNTDRLKELTIGINRALDFDVNVTEWCIDREEKWWVIDAFNEVPEIIPEALPPDSYAWIVDRFSNCIRDKLASGKTNNILQWPVPESTV